jgi:hypothetical protein
VNNHSYRVFLPYFCNDCTDLAAKQKQEQEQTELLEKQQKVEATRQQSTEDNDKTDDSERVKTGTLIFQSTAFFPWKFQYCSLSFDFRELSFCTEEASGLSRLVLYSIASLQHSKRHICIYLLLHEWYILLLAERDAS